MIEIVSTNDIEELKNRDAFVSVFLADDFDHEIIDWLYKSWKTLHRTTGQKWHVTVPSSRSYRQFNSNVSPSQNFSSNLSEKIANKYGISDEEFPCLVFDDFDHRSNMRYVRLENYNSKELKKFFKITARHIKNLDLEQTPLKHRWAFLDGIVINHKAKLVAKNVLRVAPNPFSLLKFNIGQTP